MRIGQKTLLFGGHQFFLHPAGVLLAWIRLYGWPTWREVICIVVHDWGYWFCTDIDGRSGVNHPVYGARLAAKWFGPEYRNLVLFHSRTFASRFGVQPSRLCWADKAGIFFMPAPLYLALAWLTGELAEYRLEAERAGVVPAGAGPFEWHRRIKAWLMNQVARNVAGTGPR